jgi:hypothetical protein
MTNPTPGPMIRRPPGASDEQWSALIEWHDKATDESLPEEVRSQAGSWYLGMWKAGREPVPVLCDCKQNKLGECSACEECYQGGE